MVTSNADSGAGSLRQAILDACDGSTITFDMNQVTSPITLTTGELLIGKNLTINGPTSTGLTISGNNASRIFNVQSGTVAISKMQISGGTVTGGNNGGGVLNAGTLTLINTTVSGNTAANQGGGVYNSGTLTLVNSTLSGNTGTLGGGGSPSSAEEDHHSFGSGISIR